MKPTAPGKNGPRCLHKMQPSPAARLLLCILDPGRKELVVCHVSLVSLCALVYSNSFAFGARWWRSAWIWGHHQRSADSQPVPQSNVVSSGWQDLHRGRRTTARIDGGCRINNDQNHSSHGGCRLDVVRSYGDDNCPIPCFAGQNKFEKN